MNRLVILLLVALAIAMFAASTEGIITFMTQFFLFNCKCLALRKVTTLHTAAAPAVRAAVKTALSYRNATIIDIFYAAEKLKTMLKLL